MYVLFDWITKNPHFRIEIILHEISLKIKVTITDLRKQKNIKATSADRGFIFFEVNQPQISNHEYLNDVIQEQLDRAKNYLDRIHTNKKDLTLP